MIDDFEWRDAKCAQVVVAQHRSGAVSVETKRRCAGNKQFRRKKGQIAWTCFLCLGVAQEGAGSGQEQSL